MILKRNHFVFPFTRCLTVGQYIRIPCLYCVQIGFIFPQLKVLLPPKIFKEEKSPLNFLWTGQCKSAESKEGRKNTLFNRKRLKQNIVILWVHTNGKICERHLYFLQICKQVFCCKRYSVFIVLPESGTAGPMYVNSFTVKKKENLIPVNSNRFPYLHFVFACFIPSLIFEKIRQTIFDLFP